MNNKLVNFDRYESSINLAKGKQKVHGSKKDFIFEEFVKLHLKSNENQIEYSGVSGVVLYASIYVSYVLLAVCIQ